MIAVAEDIFEEIETEVILLNGEVVRRAFEQEEGADWSECCGYVKHRKWFADLLHYYISLRMNVHRLRCRIKGGWTEPSEQGHSYAVQRMRDDATMAADARRRLKNNWPCATCMQLYNPTGRKQPWLTTMW